MSKKIVTWGSPKEYQPNKEPRVLRKVKPKQYCKKLKGKHQLSEHHRREFKHFPPNGKSPWFVEFRCIGCGHKEVEFIKNGEGKKSADVPTNP